MIADSRRMRGLLQMNPDDWEEANRADQERRQRSLSVGRENRSNSNEKPLRSENSEDRTTEKQIRYDQLEPELPAINLKN
jgi:hypothetical protein